MRVDFLTWWYLGIFGLFLPYVAIRSRRAIVAGAAIPPLRKRYKISQAVLASILNTSVSTVRQWEIGAKHPSGPSLKLLNLLDRKGLEAVI